MPIIHVLCKFCWSSAHPLLGFPHVGGGAGAVSAHQPMGQLTPGCELGSQLPLFSSGCWSLGGTEGLCPLLEPPATHTEYLLWAQPLFGGGLSPGGDVGELRSWKQLLHPCNYCWILLATSQGKLSKLSIPCPCAGAVSKT